MERNPSSQPLIIALLFRTDRFVGSPDIVPRHNIPAGRNDPSPASHGLNFDGLERLLNLRGRLHPGWLVLFDLLGMANQNEPATRLWNRTAIRGVLSRKP